MNANAAGAFFLSAEPREPRKRGAEKLRRARKLPGVVYGHGFPTQTVAVDPSAFRSLLRAAGASSLVELAVGSDKPVKVLISDVQYDSRSGEPSHVDFHQVSMTEKVTAEIALVYTGESPAVKELGAILVKNLDHLRIEALPGDLVPELPVDLGALRTLEDRILVKDVPTPSGLTVLDPADSVVALVEPPRSEEELAALSEKVEEKVEDVGVVEKPKKEEAEGEAPAEEAKA